MRRTPCNDAVRSGPGQHRHGPNTSADDHRPLRLYPQRWAVANRRRALQHAREPAEGSGTLSQYPSG
jgi:hypothetical protein